MEVITYSLRGNRRDSDPYYEAIAMFTDNVLAKGKQLIEGFQAFIKRTRCEGVRSHEEGLLESPMLGMLYSLLCGAAKGVPGVPRSLLTSFADMKRQRGSITQLADVSRDVPAILFLSPIGRHSHPQPMLGHLNKLLNWEVQA